MIVVDGRTDLEKLVELLAFPEQTHLEFKSELDFAKAHDKLNFVKDAVAMANRPPGGYILVGVDDDGVPALKTGSLDRPRFDGAQLGAMIRGYVEGEVVVVTQVHEVDGHEIALVFVQHHRDGLPVPMVKQGEYSRNDGGTKTVFRAGEVPVRENAGNVSLRHAHWNDLLRERDRRIRAEAREDVDALIAAVTAALRTAPSAPPLLVDMSDAAFVDAVVAHLEATDGTRTRQFLHLQESTVAAVEAEQRTSIIDKITIVAAQAMFFDKMKSVEDAVGTLYRIYQAPERVDPAMGLELVTRAYVLGSQAVRLGHWDLVRDIVLRKHALSWGSYSYSSWIRHGQVEASRADLFPKGRGGMMISEARSLAGERTAMRPDVPDTSVPDFHSLQPDDRLLNSLCQFDVLYCLTVAAEGEGDAGCYPAAAALHQERANAAFEIVATDKDAREQLFPNSQDSDIAAAMSRVFDLARRESFGFGGHWWSLPPEADDFVSRNLP